MTFLQVFMIAGAVILGLVTLLWLLSVALKDASIVDMFWGLGFVISAWVYFSLTPDGFITRKWLIALLVTVWGVRLSIHIFRRNHGNGEDYRYVEMRQRNGAGWWWKSYFKVFVLQGVLMWLISMPLLAAQISPTPANLTIIDFAGFIIWGIGFFFEAVGDWQLIRFKANPANKGKLLTHGVWHYTRHPNYFGDAAQWWAYYLIALAAGGYWTMLSPILMTFFLVKVSGVALLEKSLKQSKPGYEDYIQRTNAFIPWFPRKTY